MRSFGELLVFFTERAGISDAELARSAGIQRQTIFRWKEGLVARPRYRDDVLRIADKLRLTAAERDELLLAGGFPPVEMPAEMPADADSPAVGAATPAEANGALPPAEEPSVVPSHGAVTVAVTATAATQAEGDPTAADATSVVPPARRKPPRLVTNPALLLGVAVAVMLLVAAGGYLLLRRFGPLVATGTPTPAAIALSVPTSSAITPTPAPTIVPAVPGEKLLLVAPFVGYTSDDLRFNVAGRIEEALTREIADAGLTGVRVAVLPGPVAAQTQAQAWLQQTGGAALIWGEYDAGRVRALVTVPDDRARDWTSPVDSAQRLAVAINNETPAAARMLSLFTLGRLYSKDADATTALRAFERALALQPADKELTASLHFYIGTLLPRAKGISTASLTQAIDHLDQSLALEPTWENVLYNRGTFALGRALLSLDERKDLDAAVADLTAVVERQPSRVEPRLNRGIAYYQRRGPGDLDAAVADFDRAIALAPADATGYFHRGLVYIRRGEPAWQADLAQAAKLRPNDAAVLFALCWGYGLDRQPEEALPSCDAAEALDGSGQSLDSRALVYAQLGRYGEAKADLERYLAWVRATYPDLYTKYRAPEAEGWSAELSAGKNPFTPAVLAGLR